MIDPRREAVLIHDKSTGTFQDRTSEVFQYEHRSDGTTSIVYGRGRRYSYGAKRVRVLTKPKRVGLSGEIRAEVNGTVWTSATEVVTFTGSGSALSRVFYRKQGSIEHRTYPAEQVRVIDCTPPAGTAAEVTSYWNAIVAGCPEDDPLVRAHARAKSSLPDSALRAYLTAAPIPRRPSGDAPIFPFRCNLSQRQAVENGLTHGMSVIEGPPGTGKTETILNLIANIVVRRESVGVVSHTNAAVDNVRDKLDELGFGHVLATLGAKEKRATFFSAQAARNRQVAEFTAKTPERPDLERLRKVDNQLRRWQAIERIQAERRHEVAAYRLELRHFEQHLRTEDLPDLAGLPLLRRSSERLLDFLAESNLEQGRSRPGIVRRIWKYFKYGSLQGLDSEDTSVVLRLQRAYYDKRIAELDAEIARLDDDLRRADFQQLAREHQQLSIQLLHAELGARYRARSRTTYDAETYQRGSAFASFTSDYPVLLSTCHSLSASLPAGFLLDHLIIDEASQVDPLVAGLALACCRNLIVVGDARQLAPIAPASADEHTPPKPAYDCRNSILDSLIQLYGDALPRTLLREHYRCDPTIIGFCNKKFYQRELIPYTESKHEQPMVVFRTTEGNHMRQHREGGRSNQREVDVIEREVIPRHGAGLAPGDIGVTTPYRRQVGKVGDVLDQVEANTVHKFQGRQKKMVVLSTVLDETWRGRTGLNFVDDEKLINVAVSRAIQRFVLVTNHDLMPKSRHIRDLIGYIRYQGVDDGVVDSEVISIFDLLYRDFSARLRSLSNRLTNRTKYKSENIAWTVLDDILGADQYAHLTVGHQVMVKQLLPAHPTLTPRQRKFVERRASVDFVVYNRVTTEALLAIEVDGFKYHENDPKQRERDAVKDEIFRNHHLRLLRLPTTGSREEAKIRRALDDAEAEQARMAGG